MAKFKVTLTMTLNDDEYDADTLTKDYVDENLTDLLSDADNDISDTTVEVLEAQKSSEE